MKSFSRKSDVPTLALLVLLVLGAAAPATRAQSAANPPAADNTIHTPKQLAPPLDIVIPIEPAAFKAEWEMAARVRTARDEPG